MGGKQTVFRAIEEKGERIYQRQKEADQIENKLDFFSC